MGALFRRSGIQQVLNTGRMIGHAEQAGQPVGDAPENGIRLLVIFLALDDDEAHLRTRIVRSDPQLESVRRVAGPVRSHPAIMRIRTS
ncbi:hypothetical protein MOF8_22005 [Methylobacterium oryzae]|uniref:hypothetical protein n=1 Tax=Methylobacterium oryzae TaxID=334852 RepID=UPI002F2D1E23